MAQLKVKYKIQYYYDQLPRSVSVRKELDRCGIPLRTFQRDKALLIDEDTDIPASRLMKYAQIFGVDLHDLFNYKTSAKTIVKSGLK